MLLKHVKIRAEGIEYPLCVLVDRLFPRTISWLAAIPFWKVRLIIISTPHQDLLSAVIIGKAMRFEGPGTKILRTNCLTESGRIKPQVPRKRRKAKSVRRRARPVGTCSRPTRVLVRSRWGSVRSVHRPSQDPMAAHAFHAIHAQPSHANIKRIKWRQRPVSGEQQIRKIPLQWAW